ncbi:MAG: Gfo/Idh/MocA family oxidoreductase [Planctomycetes bacterium]|nr:Gfo/Idh/MocA family oxidoreductase [Planctomycetota bacterium]
MNEIQKTRWGILSTGHIAGRFAEALNQLPDAELAAVGSRDQSTADAFAAKHCVSRAHASYESLAADPDLDVIYIGTPHTFHLENATTCLRAGKAVLCEKALTINAAEAVEMVRIAREKQVFLMEAMIPRHVPLMKQVLAWVRTGRIGEVRMVKASRCARGDFAPQARQMNPALGGGSLLDVGVYVISFASMILGKSPIDALGMTHLDSLGSDEQGVALLKYDQGEIANLTFSLRTHAVSDAYILGTEGYIKIDDPFQVPTRATLFLDKEAVEVLEEPIVDGNALIYEAQETMRCLRAGMLESPLMPLDESIEIMRTMDTLRQPWGLRYSNDG